MKTTFLITIIMKRICIYFIFTLLALPILAVDHQPEFSTAGFFRIENTGREVSSMNPAWRFYKGTVADAEKSNFDDSGWEVVSLPHGIEYLPTEASGCVNYQGEAWYRKHFVADNSLKGKKVFLHFEAIMGKSKVYINGKLAAEHFGGYLPVIIDVSTDLLWGEKNVIAVWTDNSDDPIYPPGKAQSVLDFVYSGGIYRDCWLVSHNNVYITDPNFENIVAGGGLFVSYDNVSEASADVRLKIHVRNETNSSFKGKVEYELLAADGKTAVQISVPLSLQKNKAASAEKKITIQSPALWSPESPSLYNLIVRVVDANGTTIDGYRKRIGIRSVEFKGADGFWLNGKPYPEPLMGANRHQDFAIIGNAVPNSLHWRDAKKLRDTGLKLIRNAHYPQDPSFMDACDELGLFLIENTPGWQFWNNEPIFAERVYQDIRNIVRRDRNNPSVWLWEPILNETGYPVDFAEKVLKIVTEEYPYPYCYSVSDLFARGAQPYPVVFSHPAFIDGKWIIRNPDPNKTYYTREWGDNVDNWNSHNSTSRVSRGWGEVPMLVQADHYAAPDYNATAYDAFYRVPRQFVGGALWHSFDHQRGYHPDPFYGGLMDAYRQPKYSYYMFKSQRDIAVTDIIAETGPMVFIANDMDPFSPKDVTVYSNCDEVRLTIYKDGETRSYKKDKERAGMPSPIITFENAWDFMNAKRRERQGGPNEIYLLAEGMVEGKVAAVHKAFMSRRPEKLLLWIDDEKTGLEANGSDIVTVIAAVADSAGNIKRLNDYYIKFDIEGEGRIIGDASIMANPVPVKWGTAPVLIQSTLNAGTIKIRASVLLHGSQMPTDAELTIKSIPSKFNLIYQKTEADLIPDYVKGTSESISIRGISTEQRMLLKSGLKEVEQQQEDFGEKRQ